MNIVTHPPLLTVTRGLIYIMLAGIALIGVILVLVVPIATYFWPEIAAEMAIENPKVNMNALRPYMFLIAFLVAAGIACLGILLRQLLALIATVSAGDPFVLANAARLRLIGWMMIALEVISLPFGVIEGKLEAISETVTTASDSGDISVSVSGILSILLIFVLASVFERGAVMRDELEGTV
jgi:hypothetical protein